MRLFVAVVAPPEAVAHLAAALAPVQVRHPDLQWVPRERWHLTLAFYGEVPEAGLPRVRRRVARAARGAAALSLRFEGSGRFGDRVLWVGVAGQRGELRGLAADVATDGRPYRPHLTVARVRRDGRTRAAAAELATYVGPGWSAEQVRLVRSHLGPEPRHELLEAWPLGG